MLRPSEERALDSQVFVALDVEGTGMDPAVDEIIEIAIVRFTRQEVLDNWSTLVRPTHMPGPEIVQLTGIQPEELAEAPRFDEVSAVVREKVGAWPLVGHTVSSDAEMLHAAG
ncbi:MAG: 3'-5' exonuclease, partial [Chloroflexota bacterium]|nr:3'-5' exonuclease [Chloroflexota bacterium]